MAEDGRESDEDEEDAESGRAIPKAVERATDAGVDDGIADSDGTAVRLLTLPPARKGGGGADEAPPSGDGERPVLRAPSEGEEEEEDGVSADRGRAGVGETDGDDEAECGRCCGCEVPRGTP